MPPLLCSVWHNLDAMGYLVRFMLEDCCDGKVENCGEFHLWSALLDNI